ncbi:MAG: hypothetical protein MJE66_05220 [Proteobacteria bacterium]|nr:hypothetical protein [Pseudomonadota bacterium]
MLVVMLASSVIVILVGTYVAARLGLRAVRAGGLPEFSVAVALGSFAAVAYPTLLMAVFLRGHVDPLVLRVLAVICVIAYAFTVGGIAFFTYSVYRRGVLWARALTGFTVVLVVAAALFSIDAWRPDGTRANLYGAKLFNACFVLTFAWAAVEALRYYAMLRRRLALGLADPVIGNRFLLWGLGSAVSTACNVGMGVLTYSGNSDNVPINGMLQSISGFVSAATWLLTFAPPQRYLAWVRRRAGVVDVGGSESSL